MTQITNDHAEWAVVERLRRMLEGEPHPDFSVTQTYALFTTILCWVVQRIRTPENKANSNDDRIARKVFESLESKAIAHDPWCVHVEPVQHIELVSTAKIIVPAPVNFTSHTAARFLINLRDAVAHGDARKVQPFNVAVGHAEVLAGFTFKCEERRGRDNIWEGAITLLEADMRRIGTGLAKAYCGALRGSEAHRKDGQFGHDAASIKEIAA